MTRAVLATFSFILPLSAMAHQPPPPTAEQVLEEVRRAVGYDRIAELPGGIQATGTARLAGLDLSYSLLFAGDRAAVQRMQGPLTIVSAIDGPTVWITDIGGETRQVRHAERESSELGLIMLNYGYLGGESPLRFALAGAATPDEPITLTFKQTDGLITGSVTIDRESYLPSAWTYAIGSSATTVSLADYSDFRGVKLPRTITTTAASGFGSTVRIEEITDAPVFVRSPYEMPPAMAADAAFDAAAAPELEVVRSPTGHLLVHPLVNGKDVGWFIFDTGAGSTVLSAPVAAELGVELFGDLPANGVGGVAAASFCRPSTLTLGPVTMQDPLMVAIDLSFLDAPMGRRIAGLIGYNLLARTIARIDMQTPAISLHDPASFAEPLKWRKLVIDQRLPHVEAAFEGHSGLFRLDTGEAQMTVSMHEPAVRELALLEGRETQPKVTGGVGGTVAMRTGALAWFELAGRRTENMPADFATEAKGAFADPYSLGNIGGRLLEPFILVMDYSHGRIAFVPRDDAQAPAADANP